MKALLLLVVMLSFAGCEKEADDVTQIRAVIDDLAAQAQKHDINAMMEHVNSSYTAHPGSRDEQAVRPMLMLALRKYGKFEVKYPVPGIEVAQNGATADVSVPFLIVREGQQFPEMSELASGPTGVGGRGRRDGWRPLSAGPGPAENVRRLEDHAVGDRRLQVRARPVAVATR